MPRSAQTTHPRCRAACRLGVSVVNRNEAPDTAQANNTTEAQRRHSGRYPEATMAKAYWVNVYRSISNQAAFEAYAKLAGPAIAAGGGRFLVRGAPAKAYESGLMQRVVVNEFDRVEQGVASL